MKLIKDRYYKQRYSSTIHRYFRFEHSLDFYPIYVVHGYAINTKTKTCEIISNIFSNIGSINIGITIDEYMDNIPDNDIEKIHYTRRKRIEYLCKL